MPRLLIALTLMALCASQVMAQKKTAEPDYVPMEYRGHNCTGVVTSANEDTREITLTCKGEEERPFVGVLPQGYKVKMEDGSAHEVEMNELIAMRIKAYYIVKSKEVNGEEVETNEVVKIKFLSPDK